MRSIRARLLASLLSLVCLTAAVIAAVTYLNVLRESEALFDYQLRQMALSLRDQGVIAPDEAAALANDDFDFVVQIWAVDGTRIYASHPRLSLPPQAILGFAEVNLGDRMWRMYSTAARDRVIQVAQPLAIRRDLAGRAALRSAIPALILAPILAAAIVWSIGTSLRPVSQLVAELKRRDANAMEPVRTSGLPAEVSPLVDSINALLNRLRGAFDAQRAFVSDAAHELRSPLTALKLQLQLMRRSTDESSRHSSLESLSAGVERAAHLVTQLLTLARTEPGARLPASTLCDLSEAVRIAVADVVLLADAKSIRLGMEARAGIKIPGDADEVRVMVRNLVDNAVRYTPSGGTVEVTLGLESGQIVLTVDDSGPGIPASDRLRVFDRFYRRASGDGQEREETGSGLGLAIVRSIADRHSAAIQLVDSPYGGLRATVHFLPVQYASG